jgi:transcriptional regulator with XRE-family HTH domain
MDSIGLNQTHFAQSLGINQTTISKYFSGNKIPEPVMIILELKYRLNREWLNTGTGDMQKTKDYTNGLSPWLVNEHEAQYERSSLLKLADELDAISRRLRAEANRKTRKEKSE